MWCFFHPELRIHLGGCVSPKVQRGEIIHLSVSLSCEMISELERVWQDGLKFIDSGSLDNWVMLKI